VTPVRLGGGGTETDLVRTFGDEQRSQPGLF
jgi:hypothetical protein